MPPARDIREMFRADVDQGGFLVPETVRRRIREAIAEGVVWGIGGVLSDFAAHNHRPRPTNPYTGLIES